MAVYKWMQSFKEENQRKTVILLILFPLSLFLIFWIVLSLFFTDGAVDKFSQWWDKTMEIFPLIIMWLIAWWAISFFLQKDIMFWLSWAKAITRKQNPEVYNIVENLCISKWLPMPKIAIMNESWMNAFATWWRQKDSWIAFTSGLLQNLNSKEIEAVAWHELTHLINRDSLLMYVAYIFVGVVSLAGQYLLRFSYYWWSSSSDDSKKWNGFLIFWIVFYALWYLFYPLIRLAISRKREYMADLGSVELTRDNQAMISALRKISTNPNVSKANDSISSFFIAEPRAYIWNKHRVRSYWVDNNWKTKTSIRDSHPSIDDRIERLQNYY